MAGSSDDGLRTRARPGSALRRIAGVLLVIGALGAAVGAVHAHTFDGRLPPAPDGGPPALGADVGDALPFAPFVVAVVGPVGDDAGALERALRTAAASEAAFVVVTGDLVAARASRRAALADTVLRAGNVVLLCGGGAVAAGDVDPRLAAVLLGAQSFDVRARGCHVQGGAEGVAVEGPSGKVLAHVAPRDAGEEPAVDLVTVASTEAAATRTVAVPRGASLAGAARVAALAALWPLAGSGGGLAAVLAAAVAVAAAGLRLAQRQ